MKELDFKTFDEFMQYFKDKKTCLEYFESIRFKNGEFCPKCSCPKIHKYKDGKRFRCSGCKKDFSIKTGTIFKESRLPLKKWLIAIYLLSTRKKGIYSIELSQQIGVTQKTAWFMDHRIREAMKQDKGLLSGTIEADETYVDGKEKNKHKSKRVKGTQGRNTKTKTAVMGLVERGGRAKASVLKAVNMRELEKNIVSNVQIGSEIHTDDFRGYSNLKTIFSHEVVKHKFGEYVRGKVYSNTAESFWAIFKRTYNGTYHSINPKHLQRYVDESVFRWNARKDENQDIFKVLIKKCKDNNKISYRELKNVK